MSWKTSKFASSLISLFADSPPDTRTESRAQNIREAMLDSLRDATPCHVLDQVVARVYCAPNVQTLWYLRTDVMTLLSGQYGEAAAREELRVISDMFRGLLPVALGARTSPLSRRQGLR
jgi:hypothetical protein